MLRESPGGAVKAPPVCLTGDAPVGRQWKQTAKTRRAGRRHYPTLLLYKACTSPTGGVHNREEQKHGGQTSTNSQAQATGAWGLHNLEATQHQTHCMWYQQDATAPAPQDQATATRACDHTRCRTGATKDQSTAAQASTWNTTTARAAAQLLLLKDTVTGACPHQTTAVVNRIN